MARRPPEHEKFALLVMESCLHEEKQLYIDRKLIDAMFTIIWLYGLLFAGNVFYPVGVFSRLELFRQNSLLDQYYCKCQSYCKWYLFCHNDSYFCDADS